MYDPRETRHVVEINLGLLSRSASPRPRRSFRSNDVDSTVARAVREQTGGRYALLNPGRGVAEQALAAGAARRASPRRCATRHGLMSVVLWGPGEETLARERSSRGRAARRSLSPQTSIADLVALARGAALMVSGDTGPTHIAAAVGTPIVGIYGPTRPARNGPLVAGRRHRVARRDLPVPSSAALQARDGCACSTSRSPKCSTRSSGGLPRRAPTRV